ncbi:hypothetical protein AC1031_014136 [Aphanomyces cochlioides]|nr:hypothetical protein AC1031_014136 [Aphanomyces cochlioides]
MRGPKKVPPISLRRLKQDVVDAPRPATCPEEFVDTLLAAPRPPRCYGCGGIPEMCLECFSACKKKDVSAYKQSLVKGIEWLFTKATTRAFHQMSSTLVHMIFGVWKFYVQQKHSHRRNVLQMQTRVKMKKLFMGWRLLVHERRTYGAMLYASEKHARVETLEGETDQLQGTVVELAKQHTMRSQLDADKLVHLQNLVESEKRRVAEKNKEIAQMKAQLATALATVEELQGKAKAADVLAPLVADLNDYKKTCFQMANEMLTHMERQVEEFALYEGQQNLNDVLSTDVVHSLDLAEHPLLFDATAKFGTKKENDKLMRGTREKKKANEGPPCASIDRADRILMQWANALLRKSPTDWIKASRINNCNTNLQDGKAYAVLTLTLHDAMCKMKSRKRDTSNSIQRENGVALTDEAAERYMALMAHEADDQRRIEFMLNTIGHAMWLPTNLVESDDILAGDTDFNLVLLGYLFCTSSPVLDDAHGQRCSDTARQLTLERTKWRELKEAAENGGDSSSVSKKIKLALAHMIELKKKLDGDSKKAQEGHVLWWKSFRIVLRKCFLTLSLMAHGKSGFMCSAEKTAENEGFLVVPRDKLKGIIFSSEDLKWEFDMLQGYVNSVFNDLARIYRGYAARSTSSAANESTACMSQGDLVDLLKECNIPDTNFALTDLAEILVEVTQSKAAAEGNVVDVHRALMPAEFIEALIRIARKRYSGLYKKTPLSESFCLLIDNQILPYAYQSDADKFRKQVESPGIRCLLVKYLDDMKTLFAKYSLDGRDSSKKNRKQSRMTAQSLLKFVTDKNIEDFSFTNDRIMQVVGHVCQGRTLSKTELMSKEISFEAFQEAMIAMACYKFPDPYLSIENRFEKFANMYIISIKDLM